MDSTPADTNYISHRNTHTHTQTHTHTHMHTHTHTHTHQTSYQFIDSQLWCKEDKVHSLFIHHLDDKLKNNTGHHRKQTNCDQMSKQSSWVWRNSTAYFFFVLLQCDSACESQIIIDLWYRCDCVHQNAFNLWSTWYSTMKVSETLIRS